MARGTRAAASAQPTSPPDPPVPPPAPAPKKPTQPAAPTAREARLQARKKKGGRETRDDDDDDYLEDIREPTSPLEAPRPVRGRPPPRGGRAARGKEPAPAPPQRGRPAARGGRQNARRSSGSRGHPSSDQRASSPAREDEDTDFFSRDTGYSSRFASGGRKNWVQKK
ncbi:hypothetical protein AURDEDRAFT_172556 [Auricularia subglabra TFB-10046 SS5]|nr:hypothetical protein AURDEDRAFT_172556 [Auricularia subglabra TFB-10046 SS5]